MTIFTHTRGEGLQSIPKGSGEVPSCRCFGGLFRLLLALSADEETLAGSNSSLSSTIDEVRESERDSRKEGSLNPESRYE